MSPAVGNFVHDLVEMAKAMELLPQAEAENARLHTQVEEYAKTVQAREMAIIGYKDEIEALHAKVRSLEVERDDASFRTMEVEDTLHSTLDQARRAKDTLDGLIAKLDPPKPQPEPEVVQPQAVTPVEASPIPGHEYDKATDAWYPTASPEGQSAEVPTPIASSGHTEDTSSGQETVGSTQSADDLEPTKYDYYGNVRNAWREWHERQNIRHVAS